jgi:hypothetical protein
LTAIIRLPMPKENLARQAEQRILILRDQKVMLAPHLAATARADPIQAARRSKKR